MYLTITYLWMKNTYSRVHKSSDSFFSKILEKPSIVQKKMIPHKNRLDFSLRWSKIFFKIGWLRKWSWGCPTYADISVRKPARLYEISFFSALWMVFPESWKRSCPNFYAHDCMWFHIKKFIFTVRQGFSGDFCFKWI